MWFLYFMRQYFCRENIQSQKRAVMWLQEGSASAGVQMKSTARSACKHGLLGGTSGREPTCQGRRLNPWARRARDPLSVPTWKMPWAEEPGGPRSLGSWSRYMSEPQSLYAHPSVHFHEDFGFICVSSFDDFPYFHQIFKRCEF